jgi:hypothetical protein
MIDPERQYEKNAKEGSSCLERVTWAYLLKVCTDL